jgi:hypothetical protein
MFNLLHHAPRDNRHRIAALCNNPLVLQAVLSKWSVAPRMLAPDNR